MNTSAQVTPLPEHQRYEGQTTHWQFKRGVWSEHSGEPWGYDQARYARGEYRRLSDPHMGRDLINRRISDRRAIAQALLAKRREIRALNHPFATPEWVNKVARMIVKGEYGPAPEKPTYENLWREARDAIEWASLPIPSHLPCGADDHYGYRQEEARERGWAIVQEIGRPLP